MARMVIDDALWKKIETLLPTHATGGRPPSNNRLFIEAVCWVIRTGAAKSLSSQDDEYFA